jgi:hypothetical protein
LEDKLEAFVSEKAADGDHAGFTINPGIITFEKHLKVANPAPCSILVISLNS